MKRFKLLTLAVMLIAFAFAIPAQAALRDYWADVYSWDGRMSTDGKPVLTKLTSGVQYHVLAQGANTVETLYVYKTLTSLANPVTSTLFATPDRVAFRTDPTDSDDTSVDLIVVDTNGGYTAVVEDFTVNDHTIVIDERLNVQHHGIAWFSHADSSTVTDTGINFLPKTMIHDVRVEVITADSGITIDVGTADTAAGFRDDVSLTSTGFVTDTGVITAGSTLDYTAVTTYGALLYTAITGADAVATGGGRSYIGHLVNTSGTDDDLYFTISESGVDTAHGYIHYFFTRLR